MYPKITREILSKFISNQKLDNKHIGITFVTDFEDGEEVEFLSFLDRANAWKDGYVKYKSKYGEPKCNLINIRDLEDRMHVS